MSPSEDDYDSQCVKDPESGTELAQVDSSKNSVVSKLKAQLVNKDAQLVNKDAELVNKDAQLVNKDAELDGLRLITVAELYAWAKIRYLQSLFWMRETVRFTVLRTLN